MTRKDAPVYSGVLAYFRRALTAISRVSKRGNDKHNSGEPLHWAKAKSVDQPDCAARHMLTPYEIDPDTGEMHLTSFAWRALAWHEIVSQAIELELCTREDLLYGRADVAELGKMIAAIEDADGNR